MEAGHRGTVIDGRTQPYAVEQDFGPAGSLARALGPRFEARPEQEAMARLVWEVLDGGGIALVEAATGTGKSLAYLVPLARALERDPSARAVVATYTLYLQDQLVQRDIPVAEACVGHSLDWAVARGWGNYLCRLRLRHALSDREFFPELSQRDWPGLVERLAQWEASARSGARSELPEEWPHDAWVAVSADPDRCTRRRCPYFEDCFYFRARRQVHKARLVVANHHLLMADRALRRATTGSDACVLPDHDFLILDEAHHLEEVAVAHLGVEVRSHMALARLGRLARQRRLPLAGPAAQAAQALGRFVDALYRLMALLGRPVGEGGRAVLRITPGLSRRRELAGPLDGVTDALYGLAHEAARLAGSAPEDEPPEQDEAAEMVALARWAQKLAVDLGDVMGAADPDAVYWAEAEPAGRQLCLRAAMLDVGGVIAAELLRPPHACVLTSATLTPSGDFAPLRRALGLTAEGPKSPPAFQELSGEPEVDESGLTRVRVGGTPPTQVRMRCGVWEAQIPSPFRFQTQCLVGVPTDFPEPDDARFVPVLADWVAWLACGIGGRTLVLFTSYRMLEQAAGLLQAHPELEGFQVLRQGELPRTRLVDRFREREGRGQVLLGTDSFWEGLDVPGPALSCVVMCRLPFPVPEHPLVAARAERLKTMSLNPFWEDALPRAVMKFRQGFGRLIRTAADRGAVVVTDRRLVIRPYGHQFLRALPGCQMVAGPGKALLREIVQWIGLPSPS